MPEPVTPGQVCCAAYCTGLELTWALDWEEMTPRQQAAWEAAAQAVLALKKEDPCLP